MAHVIDFRIYFLYGYYTFPQLVTGCYWSAKAFWSTILKLFRQAKS